MGVYTSLGGGAGSPSNTMWPGPRPTCMPRFTLIQPTIWPHYTNITDRTGQDTPTDRHIDRQTVAQKLLLILQVAENGCLT